MWRSVCFLSLLTLGSVLSLQTADAGDEKKAAPEKGKIAGILIQREKETLVVRPDGEEELVKFVLPEKPDAKLAATLKGLFTVQRVQINYQTVGETKRVTSLVRFPGKANGTITGKVIAVHDNFWVEVKPSKGPPEGFAAGIPDRSKEIIATLKMLQPGDTVTIMYLSDFERHRIVSIRQVEKK